MTYGEPGGIRAILTALADRFGWEPHEELGNLTTLAHAGATVSLEPGGQIELSTPAARHIGEIKAELNRHLDELRAVSDAEQVAFLASGVHPCTKAEQIALMPRTRHAVMSQYLPPRSRTAHQMMRATASIQATFDYVDEADAVCKFTTALKLGPILNSIWANAPIYAGKRTGTISDRGRIWQNMDADRSGLLLPLLTDGFSFDRWIDYILDVPMLFLLTDGRYHPAGRRTFRDFLDDGIDGRFPTMEDWELQLTTVFPEVRLKKFLEVRGADAVPQPLAASVPALWKGLLYDATSLAGAKELADSIAPTALPDLYEEAYKQGLTTHFQGRPLTEWCRELVSLAAVGLARQAEEFGIPDERVLSRSRL